MSFNRVVLLGNLTRDPELRYLPKGTAVARIGMALNRVWYNDAKEKQEEVTFVDCDAFGKTAENIAKYLKKGAMILIEGRLKLDSWKDKTSGENRTKLLVMVESFSFCGGQNREPSSAPQREIPTATDIPKPRPSGVNPHHGNADDVDPQIPF